jgi:hypothetical protein
MRENKMGDIINFSDYHKSDNKTSKADQIFDIDTNNQWILNKIEEIKSRRPSWMDDVDDGVYECGGYTIYHHKDGWIHCSGRFLTEKECRTWDFEPGPMNKPTTLLEDIRNLLF